jgi:hypothetical protein
MPKCVEVIRVYDSGTVNRWEGEAAERASSELSGGMIAGTTPAPTTTTKPLRKTTVIGGLPTYSHSTAVCIGGKFYCLPDLMPDGYLAGTDPNDPGEGSVRITVEVIPVWVQP